MELHQEGLFKYPPIIETYNNTRVTHTTTSQTFKPVFTTITEATLGICEKFDPVCYDCETPTVTVWVDVTSTQHFFTSTVVEKEVPFTYTTTATDACVREIERPEQKWLGGIPSCDDDDPDDPDDPNDPGNGDEYGQPDGGTETPLKADDERPAEPVQYRKTAGKRGTGS
ncbi:MAG: hypothetical protein Q9195_005338 [Heterodermia aff. obscurata]